MSSVSGVSSSSDLYALLQSISSQQTSQTASTATSATTDDANTTTASSTHKHHHHSGGSGAIESAVTSALSSADPDADPNTTVTNAIASVLNGSNTQGTSPDGTSSSSFAQLLQANGIDPQQFQQDLQDALQGSSQQNANGTTTGSIDFATLFRSFPPGSTVDTLG